jgi:hypothetical protein
MSLKDRARAILQGNHQGNFEETKSFQGGNLEETSTPRSFLSKPQKQSTEFVTYCLAHQNSFPAGHCPIKNKRDSLTGCLGWEARKKGTLSEELLKLKGRDSHELPSLAELLRESREALLN